LTSNQVSLAAASNAPDGENRSVISAASSIEAVSKAGDITPLAACRLPLKTLVDDDRFARHDAPRLELLSVDRSTRHTDQFQQRAKGGAQLVEAMGFLSGPASSDLHQPLAQEFLPASGIMCFCQSAIHHDVPCFPTASLASVLPYHAAL